MWHYLNGIRDLRWGWGHTPAFSWQAAENRKLYGEEGGTQSVKMCVHAPWPCRSLLDAEGGARPAVLRARAASFLDREHTHTPPPIVSQIALDMKGNPGCNLLPQEQADYSLGAKSVLLAVFKSLVPTQPHPFFFLLASSRPQPQGWVMATVCPEKPKIFTLWPFIEEVCQLSCLVIKFPSHGSPGKACICATWKTEPSV